MRTRVQAIIDRELTRLDKLSQEAGLDLDDWRRLDLLIKSIKSFAAEPPTPPDTATPATMPTDDLLRALQSNSAVSA